MRRLVLLVAIVGLCVPTPTTQAQDTDEPEGARRDSPEDSRSTFAYHTDQSWSGVLDIPMGRARDHRLTVAVAFANDADLLPGKPATRLRFERRMGSTRRLVLHLGFARLTVSATLVWPRPAVGAPVLVVDRGGSA